MVKGARRQRQRRPKKKTEQFATRWAIQLAGGRFISSFSYPGPPAHIPDPVWVKSSPGIRVAECVKAIVGKEPFLWVWAESAEHIAAQIRKLAPELEPVVVDTKAKPKRTGKVA